MNRIALAVVFLAVAGCTDEGGARNALESQGFTDIQLGGYDWFGCSKSDNFATKFTAKNPQGRVVSGTVCCGMVKSCTVRW